jgi:ubiquinone/menaquinone biosynthesis C-methylase UbiE
VLDAGCGTGVVTLALREALLGRGLASGSFHAFDLTPAMLERFRGTLEKRGIEGVQLAQADVLALEQLPDSWRAFDLIVSASMLEYLPAARLAEALRGLGGLLRPGGDFVLFITKRNWLTRPLIGRWWRSNLYDRSELMRAFQDAGFAGAGFGRFPLAARHLALWGNIVEARTPQTPCQAF